LRCNFACCNSCGKRTCLCGYPMSTLEEKNAAFLKWDILPIATVEQPDVKVTEAVALFDWPGEFWVCPFCAGIKYYCPHFTKIK